VRLLQREHTDDDLGHARRHRGGREADRARRTAAPAGEAGREADFRDAEDLREQARVDERAAVQREPVDVVGTEARVVERGQGRLDREVERCLRQ
jgi:hypothetical protein